jgi:hypothetical protein
MFEIAPRIREIAEELIDRHYPHLQDAKDVIEYYIREDNGVKWLGKCKKCTAFERFQTGHMFYIFVISDAFYGFSTEQLTALVDHELYHIVRKEGPVEQDPITKEWTRRTWADKNDPDSWSIREHDIEEFSVIVDRHGLWNRALERFAESTRNAPHQMTIDEIAREQKLRAV